MIITLSPQRSDAAMRISLSGEIVTINSDVFDLTTIPDGASIPHGEIPCDWIIGDVQRVDGQLQITIRLPHGPNPPPSVAFPADIIDPPDGLIALPTDGLLTEEEADDVETSI